ncbi:hypothetical protein PRIPAC_89957 [Pristionchus pacificus]|uniref:Zinc finger protein n=1 Tax=Pristionchus pacificus TaxID=54126 RepID=A0A2A6CXV1_PRIPA|nr:hypothetical protein PRIPAC_89957 [Pristionchus pacificus]|eukprot:PDM82897.1 zinc finger protein [Pristionchus pacificus]
MESWNSVVISDDTKAFAWSGVMKAFKEDSSVPKYAKALLELLIEERREILDTQQRMVKIIDDMGRKVTDLSSAQFTSKSGESSSNQTPANSDSSNEVLDSSNGSINMHSIVDSHQSTTVEIVTGEPLFYDSFPTSSLRLAKDEMKEEEEDDYEDYTKAAFKRLQASSAKLIRNSFGASSSTGPSSSKRKRPHSSGDISSTPIPASFSSGYNCRYQDCEETFESASELEEHVKGHIYKQKHHCAVCGLGIRSETRLRDHMNQHTGERPYVCEHCGKGFTRVDAKNGHTKKCAERDQSSSRLPLEEILGALEAGSLATTAAYIDNDDD